MVTQNSRNNFKKCFGQLGVKGQNVMHPHLGDPDETDQASAKITAM